MAQLFLAQSAHKDDLYEGYSLKTPSTFGCVTVWGFPFFKSLSVFVIILYFYKEFLHVLF